VLWQTLCVKAATVKAPGPLPGPSSAGRLQDRFRAGGKTWRTEPGGPKRLFRVEPLNILAHLQTSLYDVLRLNV